MKHVLFILTCMAAFCMACSDGNDEGDSKELELSKETQQEQTLYADENGENNGIRFTAASDWTATVTEESVVRSEAVAEVEWLTLNKYSGGAGEHTLQMTIRDNLTGKTRKAKITIRCGETEIVVTVEQKAAKEDGTVVKPVQKISYRETLNSDKLNSDTDYSENFDKTFAYDAQGRVVRIETRYTYDGDAWTETHRFDYGVVGEIAITCTNTHYGERDSDEYRAKLDERGNVVTLQEKDYDGTFADYITFSYTADGRLAQWKDDDEYGSEGRFSYQDGFLSQYEYISNEYADENDVMEFPIATAYPNRYPNNGAIDFLGYIMMDDDYDFLFHIGRLGKSGDYLLETFSSDQEIPASRVPEYMEPNQTIHEIRQYVEWPENSQTSVTYRFDADKNLIEMAWSEPFTVMETEYDIVVGSELIDPEHSWMGYKYEIKNRMTKKIRDDKDTYVYTITY